MKIHKGRTNNKKISKINPTSSGVNKASISIKIKKFLKDTTFSDSLNYTPNRLI